MAMEEVESTKTDLAVAKQQYRALEQEFQDYVQERQPDGEDVASTQQRMQQEYEQRIATLTQQLDVYQANPTSTSNVSEHLQQLQHDLQESQERLVSLSDQLLRQQTVMDTQKSEISSLKSRLKVATTRAETAEAQPVSTLEMMELGSSAAAAKTDSLSRPTQRRIKGGYSTSNTSHRSIRAVLGLPPSLVTSQQQQRPRGLRLRSGGSNYHNLNLPQQIALTIDAIDTWMIETGYLLRQEPWARLGLAVYFCLIHLFCFTLVAFHTIEIEHGDLGQLTDHSRVFGLRHSTKND